MKPAAERLSKELDRIVINDLSVPLITNADVAEITASKRIQASLVKQVDHPVRWEASMRELIKREIKTAIEIGPGKVLSGLMRRITKDIKTINLGNSEDLKELSQHN